MVTYLSLIPRELNELIERYICGVKTFTRIVVHTEEINIVECINSIKNHIDTILLCVCDCCSNETYDELAKIQDENIIMVYLKRYCTYEEITEKSSTFRNILKKQIDPKELYLWVSLKTYSIKKYDLAPLHVFRQNIIECYYNDIELDIKGIAICTY
jgi:hypothetical protein